MSQRAKRSDPAPAPVAEEAPPKRRRGGKAAAATAVAEPEESAESENDGSQRGGAAGRGHGQELSLKERNRIAAQKFRQKKKLIEESLENKLHEAAERIETLEQEIFIHKQLQEELLKQQHAQAARIEDLIRENQTLKNGKK